MLVHPQRKLQAGLVPMTHSLLTFGSRNHINNLASVNASYCLTFLYEEERSSATPIMYILNLIMILNKTEELYLGQGAIRVRLISLPGMGMAELMTGRILVVVLLLL